MIDDVVIPATLKTDELSALNEQFRAQHRGHRPACVRRTFETDEGARLKDNNAVRFGANHKSRYQLAHVGLVTNDQCVVIPILQLSCDVFG